LEKIRFLYENELDSATVSASSEETGFPAERTQHEWFLKHWRSTGDENEWLKWDCGAAVEVSHFLVRYHNLRQGSSFRIQAHASDDWGAPSLNSQVEVTAAMVSESVLFLDLSSDPKTYQWWRLFIDDASNPDGFFKIGRPFAGSHFEPSMNFSFARPWKPNDPSTILESGGGQIFAIEKAKYDAWEYSFEGLSTSDKGVFKDLWRDVGMTKTFFIIEDADDVPETIYYVRNASPISIVPGSKIWDAWSVAMAVREER